VRITIYFLRIFFIYDVLHQVACHRYVQNKVMTDPECVDANAVKKSKTKTKMTVSERMNYVERKRGSLVYSGYFILPKQFVLYLDAVFTLFHSSFVCCKPAYSISILT